MTEYGIFKAKHPTGESGEMSDEWQWVNTLNARSTRAAIAAHLANGKDSGTFVAVPARSFKPVTVQVETKTALRFS